MWLLYPEQIKALESRSHDELYLHGHHLMEAAGRALADVTIRELTARDRASSTARVVVLCGHGNNGGDGFSAARWLIDRGLSVDVVGVGDPDQLTTESRLHLRALEALGGACHWVPTREPEVQLGALRQHLAKADAVVDALVGVGLKGPPREPLAAVLALVAEQRRALVVAADVPSGLDPQTGVAAQGAVRADVTVAMIAAKPGFWLRDGPKLVGQVRVADLGVPSRWLSECGPKGMVLGEQLAVPQRSVDGHKQRFGHLAVLAGHPGTAGAAVLCAAGASRSGVGLVTVAAGADVQQALLASSPEVMSRPRPHSADAADRLLAGKSALCAGPGFGTDADSATTLRLVLQHCRVPVVLDADALTLLAADATPWHHPHGPLVLTPHPAELARLLRMTVTEVETDRLHAALTLAQRHSAVVIAKGARTLVVAPDGHWAIWPQPCSALAKAGSGDVLAGVVGALLAQGQPAWQAACLAVAVHALAGRSLAQTVGPWGSTTGDLPQAIGAVWQSLSKAAPATLHDARLWCEVGGGWT